MTDTKSVSVNAIPFVSIVGQKEEINVKVTVEAVAECASRVPIDLVAVPAFGTSMNKGDTPLADRRLDQLKRAIKFIVKRLPDSDSFTIVTESTMKLLKLSGYAGKSAEKVDKIMDKVMAMGATALKPGLELAEKFLHDKPGSASTGRLGFILLLSDRVATAGIASDDRKYPVHAFGLGAAHDPEPLFSIARESGGTYSFVGDNNNNLGGDLTEALGVCLGGLKSIVAVDTRINVEITWSGDAEISKIQHGDGSQQETSSTGGNKSSAEVEVGTLYAGEAKSFNVSIKRKDSAIGKAASSKQKNTSTSSASPAVQKNTNKQLVIAATGTNKASSSKQNTSIISEVLITAVGKYKETPAAGDVDIDIRQVSIGRHESVCTGQSETFPEVAKLLARLKAIEMLRAEMIDKPANTVGINGEEDKLKSLPEKWQQLKDIRDKDLVIVAGRLPKYLQELDGHIRKMSSSDGGGGAAYLYSWLSSYMRQRATTMGSPDEVEEEFLTEKMKAEVDEARKQQHQLAAAPPLAGHGRNNGSKQDAGGCCKCRRVLYLDAFERRYQMWHDFKHEVAPLLLPEFAATSSSGQSGVAAPTHDLSGGAAFWEAAFSRLSTERPDIHQAIVDAIEKLRRGVLPNGSGDEPDKQ